MAQTSAPSASRPARRSFISVSLALAFSGAVVSTGGCNTNPDLGNEPATGGALSSSGGLPGAGGSSGAVGSGGSASGGGSSGGAAPSGGGSSGGSGTGGASSGGASSGGASNGGSGGGSEPCVDLAPPYDPEWPEATCELWAAETEDCGKEWFAEYCDVSCGRCVPEGGGTGGSGVIEEPCEDLEPPEDPEWPGATCVEWASETEECGAEWFADYCDVSCGRCVPEGGGTGGTTAVDCSNSGQPPVTGQQGHATRYWDCCQTHCSQFNGQRCGRDGVSSTGDTTSSCQGGGSFACYKEAPYAVSDCLSYGHVAKASPNCGACYRIEFTGTGFNNANDPGSKLIKGKQMIVKVSNTGSDVGGTQFDMMIPGGGVGQFNACSNQWGTSELGAQYGGFLTNCSGSHSAKKDCVRQECMKIPEGDARDGCLWFVDWFEVADNPNFTFQETSCPF